ncbi:MAG TPA: hypothetical protein VH741_06645, partial [Candidatus Limnocylindrales bacterium]
MLARSGRVRAAFTRNDGLRLAGLTAVFVAALAAVLATDALPGPLLGSNVIVNDVATQDIRAPHSATFVSQTDTERRRQEVRDQVPPQYDYTPDRGRLTAERQLAVFEETVAPIDAAFDAVLTPEARQAALRSAVPRLSATARETLVALDRPEWLALRAEMRQVLDSGQRLEIRDTVLAEARSGLIEQFDESLAPAELALANEIVAPMLVANSTYDAVAHDQARDAAAAEVVPVSYTIRAGELLVQRGERVDALAREKLDLFGLLDPRADPGRAIGWVLMAILVAGLLLGWLWRFRPTLWHRNRALLLVGLAVLVAALALKATADRSVLPYFLPTAALALLLAVLLDSAVALVVLGVVALLAGATVGTVEMAAYVLLGGLAGVVIIRRGERLAHFLQAAVVIAIVNVLVVTV